ncbi:C13 family peptidase [Parabacteroides goldsteinii]|uniref:C13 family peptidase n=1 Tax=Parabacteroides goldsteinii TaxID=328812 RepID=UPI002AB81E6B|nr:C13 family peptidase [Parabacteroides goldsteinii]MDZ3927858.1 C13 family peptidase [Parabacteroides goldsteinii]
MKRIVIKLIAPLLCLIGLWSCSDDESSMSYGDKQWTEKTVAVVLPMEKGLAVHWERTLGMFATNFERAFKNHETGIRLKFEYYDEANADMQELARSLAFNDEVYAVVGGLYSSNAAILAAELTLVGKTFFTLATTEQLVRAYASTGYLWAMTETDITQCEVLLSKVINYGGKSVALLAKDNDNYGQTFIDWFAFQARELGLKNMGSYAYTPDNIADVSCQAMQSGTEYVICIPSEIEEMGPMLEAHKTQSLNGQSVPRMLFSDTAYGADVLKIHGDAAEGIEGVAFGADPESGFDVSYRTFFNATPTLGESQLHDAAMLIGYAAWHQQFNPELSLQKSLRAVVSGEDLNMGSWTGEDMGLVVDALAAGKSPYVRGASGHLRFDAKVFTNVLATTYYNFKVYNGQYIILDYNTSDGGNRTDATLAGWNWKASQMQNFNNSGEFDYPVHTGNWALLVASSKEWANYRHQADVLAIYQQLKQAGYTDDRIILIAEDDIADNVSNPNKGVVQVTIGGNNVYEQVEIDYRMSELQAKDILAILSGEKSERLPIVIESTANDNVFVFWSGHGVPGALCWNDDAYGIMGDQLDETFHRMREKRSYRKLLMMVEACFSGGVMEQCRNIPGMLFVTAANGDETSKADVFNGEMKVWMSNRFTSTFIEQITENKNIALRDLYYRLFINTVGSHVMVYNAENYGNLYSADMSEFINFKK